MKVVILAGGRGSRMVASGQSIPKPVVRIGDRPILWHLTRYLAAQGFNDNLVATGYRQQFIHETLCQSADKETDDGALCFNEAELDWQMRLLDTGKDTQTGGRLGHLRAQLQDTFILLFSDALMDVDLQAMRAFHGEHGKLASILAVQAPSRFGRIQLDSEGHVTAFKEKQVLSGEWINGGVFILEPEVLDLVSGDKCRWNYDVLPKLAEIGELMAWKHDGYWRCADYAYEVDELNARWLQGDAPWAAS